MGFTFGPFGPPTPPVYASMVVNSFAPAVNDSMGSIDSQVPNLWRSSDSTSMLGTPQASRHSLGVRCRIPHLVLSVRKTDGVATIVCGEKWGGRKPPLWYTF